MKNISLLLKILSFLALVFIWIYTIIYFSKLPETVPTHFGINGKADGFGSKSSLWHIPFIAILNFLLLFYMSKNKDFTFLNIPKNLKENTAFSVLCIDILNFWTMLLFAVITYETIQTSLGNMQGISSVTNYLIGFILIFTIAMMVYSYRLSKKMKQT
ncbi:MAG: DUF1648 domain-containing protein [Bergeyella sp.]